MNAKKELNAMSRRRFLGYSALGLAGLTILPSRIFAGNGRLAPSDRIVMGFIGLGQQGLSDFRSFSSCPGVQVVACCDVDSIKRERFKRRVEAWQKEQNVPQRCDTYEFYEDLLARKDIDAVAIATPDHWHALIAIHACRAKKDVYVQKPMSFTITESLQMVKAVRENKAVLQVGSQQRSAEEFQQAIALIRSGALGYVETIYAKVGDPPTPLNLPEQPIPANLNWNQWLGPLNDPKIHYHQDLCPPVSLKPEKNETLWGAWRWYRETGNGFTADWGAHMFDIAQAAIGMDGSGPCEYIPKGYNGAQYLTMKYQNGIVMTEQPFTEKGGNGICFNTTKGWLKVARGYIECSDAQLLAKIEQEVNQGEYEVSSPHMQNFIDAVRSRKNPIAPVEVGCSTNILCVNANIATELQRPVKWDPATLSYGDDSEAANHRLYNYQYRKPYTLY
ncbi:MAG: Gfo/Idh/MocA family oxidoreductase [Bacteroidales bacterium]|jgi:predicted dehydrogenase|nr:Gfo/Idh/MocA family oxidoreductase [Bacteroidales bacterium]